MTFDLIEDAPRPARLRRGICRRRLYGITVEESLHALRVARRTVKSPALRADLEDTALWILRRAEECGES